MPFTFQDVEETEKLLLDAGFCVGEADARFVVYLQNRKVTRSEVAEILGCETEQLSVSERGFWSANSL